MAAAAAAVFVVGAPDGQVDASEFTLPPDASNASLGPAGPAVLDARTLSTLTARLATAPRGSPVWLAVADTADLATGRRVQQLREAFAQAGWRVEPLFRSPRTRPGYQLLLADEGSLPRSVEVLVGAFQAAGLPLSIAAGYREHYARRQRSQAGFSGFPMSRTQTFVLTVSRADR